ncbi:MAG TPA: hypothetical protein VM870_03210 [Pyrinomonadaceae bacterium]|nr:hypothetical protein [Pyrinomonadaceae bacterium]
MKTRGKKPFAGTVHEFTPAEQRAARSERIKVYEAEPYGWIARSDEEKSPRDYHLFCEPHTKRLACTCADFVYRGNAEPGYECKHVSAVLKFIARRYLASEYDPQQQISARVA